MSTVTVSSSAREHRITVRSIARAKREGEKLTMLTAYDFTFARIFDSAGIELILVGDSLGNVVQGCDTTLPSEFPASSGGRDPSHHTHDGTGNKGSKVHLDAPPVDPEGAFFVFRSAHEIA